MPSDEQLVLLAQQGRYEEVVKHCEEPRRRRALSTLGVHVYGVALIQMEQFGPAIEILESALVRSDAEQDHIQSLAIRNDLSKACFAAQRYDKSVEHLSYLVDEHPQEITFAKNLILVLDEAQRSDEAIERCRAAVLRWPHDNQLAVQLGELMMSREAWAEASEAFQHALELDPSRESTRKRLVTAYRRLDDQANVTKTLSDWLQFDPDNVVAAHLLAATQSGQAATGPVPSRAPAEYVRHVFDQFAETFEQHLGELGYSGPRIIASLLAERGVADQKYECVLDAGCGTGLMCEVLRPVARRLVGVDLSPQMLQRAASREYDTLVCAELVAYFDEHVDSFDLIISADTFIYFGDLEPAFSGAYRSLKGQSGLLVFSVEKESSSTVDFQLNPSGRYSHTAQYVRDALQRCGFCDVRVAEAPLRNEAGVEIAGLYWTARKPKHH